MIAYINVFTAGYGYTHHVVNLGFTVLPKYQIKKLLLATMNKWFIPYTKRYVRAYGSGKKKGSWIVHISFINK